MASSQEESATEERVPLIENNEKSPEKESRRTKLLVVSFVLMVIIGLGNKIFQKLQTLPMYNYPYFLNLFSTFIYIPLSFAYIFPMMIWGKEISAEQRAIPWYKFAIMGGLDGIAGMMQSFAVNYIPSGGLIILLYQSAIPISMIISKPMVKAKYNIQHYLGAVIVVAGLLVVLIPALTAKSTSNTHNESNVLIFVWCMVLIFSCVPMTLSSVYKEKALGEVEIDVVYLNGWVAIYQFIISIALCIPAAYASQITIKDIPTNFANGARCYVGINSAPTDQCGEAPLFVSLYLGFNVMYNILIIMILKYGSANILWLAMTIMVPLGNAAFALKFVPGNQPLRPTDIVGLVVIMAGLILYRFWGLFSDLYTKAKARKQGSVN